MVCRWGDRNVPLSHKKIFHTHLTFGYNPLYLLYKQIEPMKTELKEQLLQGIQTGKLKEAIYYTKWYGSYETCLVIWGYEDGTFTIRKDDINQSGYSSRTHYIHNELTADQVSKMLNKIRKNTYYLFHYEEYEN